MWCAIYNWVFNFVVQIRNDWLEKGDSQAQNKTLVMLHVSS